MPSSVVSVSSAAEFDDNRNNNYPAFIHERRKRQLRLKVNDLFRVHEEVEFWRHEATVPEVARLLDVREGELLDLFRRSRRYSPSHLYHRLVEVADRKAKQVVGADDLVPA